MIERNDWKEFQKSGLLWWINMILHTFGWALVIECSNDGIEVAYPARVKFRGFQETINTVGYEAVSKYLCDNSQNLYDESSNKA